ncbi:MAG: type II toxin-antitoxin system PemK/MazF family toxin [Acidobacteriota bacterium]|nr:type II toxin-antitoxin system PemK/MazF family toxin [Acidobacteriota bacterium]
MSGPVRRGDIRVYEAGSGEKTRLVVVLTRNGAIPFLPGIMVAPVTTVVRGLPSEVALQAELGLKAPAVANLDAVMTVSRARLGALAGRLSDDKVKQVGVALRVATGYESDERGVKPAS